MGNSGIKTQSALSVLSIKSFKLLKVIGRGGFGKVWKAEHIASSRIFALKEMSKIRVVKKNSVGSVLKERSLLSVLKHPYLVNMQFAFQDFTSLYLVMDLMQGGDLRNLLFKIRQLTESQTKFIVCCILMGLEYLHINEIIHRDIKPENLVFDNKGYLRITDFGIAEKIRKDNSNNNSGTPGYMSPEVMLRKNHSIESDYFALGVIAFECMTGRRPYVGRTRNEIKEQIMIRQVQLKKSDVPEGWSPESADFINKLIKRNPKERLGSNGSQELKNHSWLLGAEWKKLLEKKIESPLKLLIEKHGDPRVCEDWVEDDKCFVDLEFIQNYFAGYYFESNSLSGNESTLGRKN